MHHANHFYGHAHIVARYAGLAEVPRIWGYLQHGWNVVDGYAVGTAFAPGFPKFVWSDASRRRGWTMGRRHDRIVGSPWAYLLRLEQPPGGIQRLLLRRVRRLRGRRVRGPDAAAPEDPVFGGNQRLSRLWPVLHQPAAPMAQAAQIAHHELGMDAVLSPVEIIQAFGWTHARMASIEPEAILATEGDVSHAADIVGPHQSASRGD